MDWSAEQRMKQNANGYFMSYPKNLGFYGEASADRFMPTKKTDLFPPIWIMTRAPVGKRGANNVEADGRATLQLQGLIYMQADMCFFPAKHR